MMSNDDFVLAGDYAIVGDVVNQHRAGFEAKGFEFSSLSLEGTLKMGRYPCFHFLNKRTGMWIHVSFSAANAGLNGGFVVSIEEPGNRSLNIKDFLKLNGRDELIKFFTYRDPDTDVRSFADYFLLMLLGLFETDLKPILAGKTFEETPIDWMGYR